MIINTLTLNSAGYPQPLRNNPGKPKTLYHMGADLNKLLKIPAVAIVGSRRPGGL